MPLDDRTVDLSPHPCLSPPTVLVLQGLSKRRAGGDGTGGARAHRRVPRALSAGRLDCADPAAYRRGSPARAIMMPPGVLGEGTCRGPGEGACHRSAPCPREV